MVVPVNGIIEISHSQGLILHDKSYAPMHIRGGAFGYACMYVCVKGVNVEVEAEWAPL